MRNVTRGQANGPGNPGIPKSVWIISAFITIFLLWRFLSHSSESVNSGNYLLINKGTGSSVSVFLTSTVKKNINNEEKLFETDTKMEVETGEGNFSSKNNNISGFVSVRGAIGYRGMDTDKELVEIVNGMVWIEADNKSKVALKNIKYSPEESSTIIGIQNNQGSTLYILKGKGQVEVDSKSLPLSAGNKITILNSEVKMPGLNLSEKVEVIDDSIRSDEFFILHGGNTLLQGIKNIQPTQISTGNIIGGTGTTIKTIGESDGNSLEISYPTHDSVANKNTFDITGIIKNPAIKKVTIDNKDAAVSPVEGTFMYKDFRIEDEINDIVYKGYDASNNLIDKGFITVYANAKSIDKAEKPSVTSYPINDKLFTVLMPKENPYKTTENIVRIEGTVPVNTVKYITINDFKLTKFRSLSTDWYYFANKDYNTMNDGINLYKIRYYDVNDKLISEQLFTIVKEAAEVQNQ